MTTIPPSPGPGWVFNPPPGWNAPAGFDPAKGHVVDPTWPDAPPDWQFWTEPPPIPVSLSGSTPGRSGLSRTTWIRIGIGAFAIILLITRLTWLFGSGQDTGVGSCWKSNGGTQYTPVDCSDPAAAYKVSATVSDPDSCPSSSDSYLETNESGSSKYRCLEPVSR